MVENVVQQTKAQAVFSFDFLCLCIVASVLAAVGLAIDSPVVVVASMLVSPIMGPILAVTFGSVVYDWKLVKVGVLSELISLLICVADGFVVGLCFAPYGVFFGWPTGEMSSRGSVTGLIVGLAIALPSGIGVALSVLGNNTSSLVGVAISASLLPPAVNCGMCFAYAILGPRLHPAEVDAVQLFNIGSISFLLTILNIACVYIAAFGMYKVKEVVPLPGKTHFWKQDVAVARNYNAMDAEEARTLQEGLARAMTHRNYANTLGPSTLSDLTIAGLPQSVASSLTWHPNEEKHVLVAGEPPPAEIKIDDDDDDDTIHHGDDPFGNLFKRDDEQKPPDSPSAPSLTNLFRPPNSPEGIEMEATGGDGDGAKKHRRRKRRNDDARSQ